MSGDSKTPRLNVVEFASGERPPAAAVVRALRNIADELEAGEYGDTDEVTLVLPGASEVFHLGGRDSEAGSSALFNCSCAITKITLAVCRGGGNS